MLQNNVTYKPIMKKIRFIDSRYTTIFEISNGEKILIKSDNVEKVVTCHFVDDYHFKLNKGQIFHIAQFAEHIQKTGSQVEPVR